MESIVIWWGENFSLLLIYFYLKLQNLNSNLRMTNSKCELNMMIYSIVQLIFNENNLHHQISLIFRWILEKLVEISCGFDLFLMYLIFFCYRRYKEVWIPWNEGLELRNGHNCYQVNFYSHLVIWFWILMMTLMYSSIDIQWNQPHFLNITSL